MKKRSKIIIAASSAIVVILGAVIAVSSSGSEPPTVLTETVQVRNVSTTVAASGTVDPAIELGLQFPSAATSELKSLQVKVGDQVASGELLAEISSEALAAAVASAESGLASSRTASLQATQALETAKQAVIAAELNYENVFDEFPSSIANNPNQHLALQNAEAQQASAQAQLAAARQQVAAARPAIASAEAQLKSALSNLEKASMTAPTDGTIVAVASGVGEPIGSTSVGTNGTTGFIILAALDDFVVTANFAESDVVGISEGQRVSLEFDALPDQLREGRVIQVAPFGDVDPSGSALTTYEVSISIPNPPAQLRAGMTAQASITTQERIAVIAAPVTALVATDYGFVARVQDASGEISNVEVQLGIRGGYYVEITAGLSEGDLVVTGSDGELPPTDTGFGGGRPDDQRENPDLN